MIIFENWLILQNCISLKNCWEWDKFSWERLGWDEISWNEPIPSHLEPWFELYKNNIVSFFSVKRWELFPRPHLLWILDWRLHSTTNFLPMESAFSIPANLQAKIWVPDLHIVGAKKSVIHSSTSHNSALIIRRRGFLSRSLKYV